MQFDINDQFCWDCCNSDIIAVKKLLYDNPHVNISFRNEEPFRNACRYGQLEIAKWLLHVRPQINISAQNEEAFRWTCFNGHLDIAKWLLEIRPQINISVNDEEAFRSACAFRNGRLDIAKWLLEIRPQINISAKDDYAFRHACERGHLETAKWLQTLNPYLYTIKYNSDGGYVGYYIRTKEEVRWEQTKYLVWLSSTQSPNKQSILYNLPFDISRYIIQNFI